LSKFYYISLRYSGPGFDGRDFVLYSCGVSGRHPFRVLESIRQDEANAEASRLGLALDPYGRTELIGWQEISEEEYQLGISKAAETGTYDLDAGSLRDK
jgi:hypothetical protein